MAFATELATVPARVPYLRAPERWPAALAAMLPRPPLARIGIAWSGDPLHHNDGNRSIPFKRFRSLIEGAARPFISLQKEVREIDRVVLAATPAVTNFARQIRDFADTAALIGEVDLVIAVDTSVAHLAGALGKPVWLLLPFAPDWRWLLERSDSPWYPTMRLFRQPRPGDWDAVFASVQAELNALFPSHS
jgi:ADP-heptose:LPS heptosyltransferase